MLMYTINIFINSIKLNLMVLRTGDNTGVNSKNRKASLLPNPSTNLVSRKRGKHGEQT